MRGSLGSLLYMKMMKISKNLLRYKNVSIKYFRPPYRFASNPVRYVSDLRNGDERYILDPLARFEPSGALIGRGFIIWKMKYSKGTFATIPNIELLEGKNPILQTIYMWMCKFSNENGTCFPSQKKLSECSWTSIDSCRRYLKELEEMWILRRERRYSDWQEITSMYYLVVGGSSQQVPPSTDQPPPSSQQGGVVAHSREGPSTKRDGTKPTELNPLELNILSKDNIEVTTSEITEYWKKEINETLEMLRKAVWVTDFKESIQWQRRYAKNIFDLWSSIWREEFIDRLKAILSDKFKAQNCNKLAYLYGELKSYIHSPIVSTENERKIRVI